MSRWWGTLKCSNLKPKITSNLRWVGYFEVIKSDVKLITSKLEGIISIYSAFHKAARLMVPGCSMILPGTIPETPISCEWNWWLEQPPGGHSNQKNAWSVALWIALLFPSPEWENLHCGDLMCTGRQHQIQWLGRGAKKHEIYVAAFGGHLFYDLFVQGWGGAWPPRHPPGSATGKVTVLVDNFDHGHIC